MSHFQRICLNVVSYEQIITVKNKWSTLICLQYYQGVSVENHPGR